jgi:23S rRNA (cytosine1962-C5)-methyltransferase
LKPAAQGRIRSGHPWIFAQSIREQNREGEAGELAVVFDSNDQFLAVGLYDPLSQIRVRVLHSGKPARIDDSWWREKLKQAALLRAPILSKETNGARLINGESDGFPALVLDRYGHTLVLKLYSGVWFARLPSMISLIEKEFDPKSIVLRLSRNIHERASRENLRDGQLLSGEAITGSIRFLENGLTFEADVLKGQKTGFFLDQRENRAEVGKLAEGKTVLNAFSFSGGFSVYAGRGGARAVTDVDISTHALKSAERNWALNRGVMHGERRAIQADVFEWLETTHKPVYDLIILDPPSFAKRETDRAGALRAYSRLAVQAVALARRKAMLVCCSCSAHIPADEFFATITGSLQRMSRRHVVLKTTREPADHHAAFAEAQYLKGIYLQLTD